MAQTITEYRGAKLVDIPSEMGGSLPAALTGHQDEDGRVYVVCLHPEFYTNWVFTAAPANIKPWTWGSLTPAMKRIIASRVAP